MTTSSPKRPGRSFSDERRLIELAKTSNLTTIVKKTGKKPEAVLKMARRLCLSIRGKTKTKAQTRGASRLGYSN
jgi:hypothetical protein